MLCKYYLLNSLFGTVRAVKLTKSNGSRWSNHVGHFTFTAAIPSQSGSQLTSFKRRYHWVSFNEALSGIQWFSRSSNPKKPFFIWILQTRKTQLLLPKVLANGRWCRVFLSFFHKNHFVYKKQLQVIQTVELKLTNLEFGFEF